MHLIVEFAGVAFFGLGREHNDFRVEGDDDNLVDFADNHGVSFLLEVFKVFFA